MSEYEKTIEVNSLVELLKEYTSDPIEFITVPTGYLLDAKVYLQEMVAMINTPDLPKTSSGCPNPDCESDKLNCSGSSHEDELVIKYYECLTCHTSWTEVYRFIHFTLDKE